MKIQANEIRKKDETIYIVVDDRDTDVFENAYTTFEEAQDDAEKKWQRLTHNEKKEYKSKKYHLYVCSILWNLDYLHEIEGEDASFQYRHSEKIIKDAFDSYNITKE